MNRLKKAGITVLSLVLTASSLILCGCNAGQQENDTWLASVNGERILQSDVESMVKSMEMKYLSYGVSEEEFYGNEESRKALYEGVLDALIDLKLVPALALQKGMDPLTEDEMSVWYNQGNAELAALRETAKNREDVTLSEMLAFFGCTEEDYVEKYVSSKVYNLCYQYLSDLAEVKDSDIQAYYDRLLEQQKKVKEDSPEYLGNYVEEGTILFFPDDAVCVEYITLDENCPDTDEFEAIEAFYGENAKKRTAVVFPGSAQFSEETLGKILSLKPGETTGRTEEKAATLIFRRTDDPSVPKGWEELPDSLMNSLKKRIGEGFVEELLLNAREQGMVEYPAK
ncbi:MAG: hypothetical protein IJJ92_08920 [Clostridia bacterium]|nr:hypothetical protein [Clostridia bacterium]